MISVRPNDYRGYVAVDHVTAGRIFDTFLRENGVKPDTFIGIDADFPSNKDDEFMLVEIIFKSDDVIEHKELKMKVSEFFHLFTRFRVVFAPQHRLEEFVKIINS